MLVGKHQTRIALATALLFGSACGVPKQPDVESAQKSLRVLKQDEKVYTHAARELDEAEEAVARAKNVWAESENEAEAKHLAYLAQRRIEIAQVKVGEKLSKENTKELLDSKDEMILQARTKEALEAREEAEYLKNRLGEESEKLRRQESQLTALTAQQKMLLEKLEMTQSKRGLQMTLGDVIFESNKAKLKPGAERKLAPLAKFLKDNPEQRVVIEGHTDDRGTDAYNNTLSENRAQAVKDKLVALQIDPSRIASKGMGEAYPLTSNGSEAGRQQNRRVEIFIVGEESPTG